MPALRPGRALRPLLSLQARSLLYGLGFRGGRGRARLLGAAALVVLLAGMAVAYMWVLGGSMVAVGAAGAIPALAALAGSLAAVALVFVKAPGTVFGCRDYDLVAALPVPVVGQALVDGQQHGQHVLGHGGAIGPGGAGEGHPLRQHAGDQVGVHPGVPALDPF